MNENNSGFLNAAKKVCTARHGLYIYIAVAAFILYYLLFLIVSRAGTATFFYEVPGIFIILLILTSAILFSISIYAIDIRETGKRMLVAIYGLGSTIAGGLVTSCGCTNTLVEIILSGIGFGSHIATNVSVGIEYLRFPIIIFFILFNCLLIYIAITGKHGKKY
jgi:hypothetical protein